MMKKIDKLRMSRYAMVWGMIIFGFVAVCGSAVAGSD